MGSGREHRAGRRTAAGRAAVCGLFAALITVGACFRVAIPAGADVIHFTLQWYFVLLAALILEPRLSVCSVCIYLLAGLVGFPVFARGGGPAYLLRPTFGFLLGFVPAAAVTGALARQICCGRRSSGHPLFFSLTAACLPGYLLYYSCGLFYFYLLERLFMPDPPGLMLVLSVYCLPTMLPDLALCALAAWTAARLKRELRHIMDAG